MVSLVGLRAVTCLFNDSLNVVESTSVLNIVVANCENIDSLNEIVSEVRRLSCVCRAVVSDVVNVSLNERCSVVMRFRVSLNVVESVIVLRFILALVNDSDNVSVCDRFLIAVFVLFNDSLNTMLSLNDLTLLTYEAFDSLSVIESDKDLS